MRSIEHGSFWEEKKVGAMEKRKPVTIKATTNTLFGDKNYVEGDVIENVPALRAEALIKAGRAVVFESKPEGETPFQNPEDEMPNKETATPPNTKETATPPKVAGNGKPTPPKVD